MTNKQPDAGEAAQRRARIDERHDTTDARPGEDGADGAGEAQRGARTDARPGAAREVEVVVVGGGPAGLSAALWLGRMLHDVVLIDSGDPRNWETRGIHGFLGSPDARPAELRAMGRERCRAYGVELIDDAVDAIHRRDEDARFTVRLAEGAPLTAQRILLATGVRDVWPELPGLARAYGRYVHTCPLCDGYDVRGGHAVIVGAGRHAMHTLLELATWTRHLTLCTLGQPPDLDAACRRCLSELGATVRVEPARALREEDDGGGAPCWLELEGGDRLDFDHLFIAMGQDPRDDLAAQLGCGRDAQGRVCVDERQRTSVPGVYAAGDLTPGPQLAIKAAGEGAKAALGVHKSLLPEAQRLDD